MEFLYYILAIYFACLIGYAYKEQKLAGVWSFVKEMAGMSILWWLVGGAAIGAIIRYYFTGSFQ